MNFHQNKFPFTIGLEIQNICAPLFQSTDICYFEYIKSFSDGSFITLTNNLSWLEHYIRQEYYKISFTRHTPNTYKEGYILTSSLAQGSECVHDAAVAFNVDHCISLVEPGKASCEFYIFGAMQKNNHIINFYLNNLDLLKKFTYYFHDKAEILIAKHLKDKFKSPILQNFVHPQGCSITQNKELDLKLMHERYPLFNNREEFLSKRETECLQWLSQGKSSNEIGVILNLSKRTVESHISNIKKKMKCYKTTRLIYLGQKLSLI